MYFYILLWKSSSKKHEENDKFSRKVLETEDLLCKPTSWKREGRRQGKKGRRNTQEGK